MLIPIFYIQITCYSEQFSPVELRNYNMKLSSPPEICTLSGVLLLFVKPLVNIDDFSILGTFSYFYSYYEHFYALGALY